jgi:hypothetical protein
MILNSPTISGSLTVTGNIIASGSITLSGSVASASFATSASNATNAISASYANNLTVAGTLTAQTLVVQTITSSVLYSSGSNVFGNNIANTQVMTGSVTVTGSLAVVTNGTEFQVNASGVKIGNVIGDAHSITGSVGISGSITAGSLVTFTSANNGKIFGSTGATTGYQYAEMTNTGGNLNIAVASSTGVIWGSGNGGAYNGTIGTANATDFVLATDNTGRMTITSAGNVGIGTSTPNFTSVNRTTVDINGPIQSLLSFSSGGTPLSYIFNDGYNFTLNTASGYMNFQVSGSERMRIATDGDFLVGTTTNSGFTTSHRIKGPSSTENTEILSVDGGVEYSGFFRAVSGANYNTAACGMVIGRNTSTLRSINAGGTINASGADYAEYMTKAIEDTIAKGDIVGVNAEGKLTNIFEDSISFVVKSTDPSYVGGDTWGNNDAIGKEPRKEDDQTDEEYEQLKAEHEAKIEEARAKVDRIAFSGQVPCNVYNANVGDYIIPINDNGKIGGQAITNPTFEQYQISVGKVWKIMEDERAWIAVKIG